jgi:hypothetical protein
VPRTVITWCCANCAKPFDLSATQAARVRKDPAARCYCSRACAGVERAVDNCDYCGIEYHPHQNGRRARREGKPGYCSTTCFNAARVAFTCVTCSDTFFPKSYTRRMIRRGKEEAICDKCKHKQGESHAESAVSVGA